MSLDFLGQIAAACGCGDKLIYSLSVGCVRVLNRVVAVVIALQACLCLLFTTQLRQPEASAGAVATSNNQRVAQQLATAVARAPRRDL